MHELFSQVMDSFDESMMDELKKEIQKLEEWSDSSTVWPVLFRTVN